MSLIGKIQQYGIAGSARMALNKLKTKSGYTNWRFPNVTIYANPTPSELVEIEYGLMALGIVLHDYLLRNKNELGKGIYCHFILEIEK